MPHFNPPPGRGCVGSGVSPQVSPPRLPRPRIPRLPGTPHRQPCEGGEESLVSQHYLYFPLVFHLVPARRGGGARLASAWSRRLEITQESKLPHVNSRKLGGCQSGLETHFPRERLLGLMLMKEKKKKKSNNPKQTPNQNQTTTPTPHRIANPLLPPGLATHAVLWGCPVLPRLSPPRRQDMILAVYVT